MIIRRHKIGIMAILMVTACFLMYYFHVVHELGTFVSHIFYIPIIVACVWWKRKGLIVAVFSSAFLIFCHTVLRPDVATLNEYFRAAMFLVIAFIVAELSERIAKDQEVLQAANQQLTASQHQLKAFNQQLQASEQQLRAANQQLDTSNQQLRASEEEVRKVNHDLEDRVKELHCLYGLSQLVQRHGTTVEEIFQGLAELIPAAWEYSQITAARIVFEDRCFETANFRKTAWLQSADINVHHTKAGTIEVCYLQERPLMDEGPFVREERELLNLLARRLGHLVERIRAEQELNAAHQQLLAGEQQLKASNQQLRASGQQLQAANQQLQATEQQLRAGNQQLEAEIVERKNTEKALRESEERFRLIVESAFDGISISEVGPNMSKRQLVSCNDRYVEMSGYTREQLMKAKNLNDLIQKYPSDESTTEPLPESWLDSSAISTGLGSWKRPDGKENVCEWSAVSIKRDDHFQIISIDRDITERKKAEKALRESEERFRLMVETAFDGIYVSESVGDLMTWRIIFCNDQFVEMSGYSREQIMKAENIANLRISHNSSEEKARGRDCIVKGMPFTGQGSWKRPDGKKNYFEWSAVAVKKGDKYQAICIDRDITERMKTERALQESEERFRLIVESAFDGISIAEFDADTNKWRLVFCNDLYVEASGYTREQLFKAQDVAELLIIHDSAEKQAQNRDCIVNCMPSTGLASWKRPDGKENFCEWSAASVKKGNKFQVIGIDRDITERKKVEEKLRDHQRRLRDLASELVLAEEHLRRRIARNLHDDVGQDLLSIKMRLAELRKGRTSAKQAAALEGILKSVNRTIQNTRSLLFDLSPPVLYELGFEPAVEWLAEKAKADHGIDVVFEDDSKPKPLTDDLRIGLFRAVRELLLNVVKHAQAKNVKVSTRREGSSILVRVEDDGVGFDPEQIQTPGDLSKGFGLFDIRERLQHFGGSFQLQSKPGHGTQVTLLAPLK